jgi:RNA polymerase sigma factor (sigma-70 family)
MSPGLAAAQLSRPAHLAAGDLQGLPDEKLLARFFQTHDEAAFGVLLARHGPLVLGVCRRVLGNSSDADDAFQATFLVLVCKGRTLREPGQLASWLYGVAQRTARKLKSKAALRYQRERQASAMPITSDAKDMTLHELQGILDEEISRLPAKYALPLVLCYLEGKTNAQAAAHLGWPEGSMSRRLSRARELLRSRLARRGMALSVALITSVFSQRAEAAVPAELASATLSAGLRVVQGAAVKEVAAPATAAVVGAMLAATATSKLATSTMAALAIVAAMMAIGWQLGTPAFAANLFLRGKSPHALSGSPVGGSTMSVDGVGCGAAPVAGCGAASACGQ